MKGTVELAVSDDRTACEINLMGGLMSLTAVGTVSMILMGDVPCHYKCGGMFCSLRIPG